MSKKGRKRKMKVTTQIECKCGILTPVKVRKPDYFTPSVGTYFCDGCDSRLQYKIEKAKVKNQVSVSSRVIAPTDTFFLLLAEAQQKTE